MLVLSTGEGKVDLGKPSSMMMKERKMAAILISKMHVMNQCMKTIIEAWVSARGTRLWAKKHIIHTGAHSLL